MNSNSIVFFFEFEFKKFSFSISSSSSEKTIEFKRVRVCSPATNHANEKTPRFKNKNLVDGPNELLLYFLQLKHLMKCRTPEFIVWKDMTRLRASPGFILRCLPVMDGDLQKKT